MVWFICPLVFAFIASFGMNFFETYVSTEYYDLLYTDEIAELMESVDDEYYRTDVMYIEWQTVNRSYGDNYYGTSVYSSTSNDLYQKFYETYMGNNETYRNCFLTAGARNELFFTFMGAKYIVSETDPGMYYNLVKEGEHLNLYENDQVYPVIYKSSALMSEEQLDKMVFPYTAEALMNYTVVEDGENISYDSVLKQCDVEDEFAFVQEKDEKYTIELGDEYKNKIIYLTFQITNEGEYWNKKDISIMINGAKNRLTQDSHVYYNENTVFDYVLSMEDITTLDIEIIAGKYEIKNLKMYVSDVIYTEHDEVSELHLDKVTSKITCKVDAKEGEYLVTSIPYDSGFTAYINGEEVETIILNKAFLGIPLKDGENQITIQYHAPLLKEGKLVSLVGFLLLLIELLKGIVYKIFKKYREIIMYLIFGVLTTVVSLMIYFVCTNTFLKADDPVQLQISNIISWIGSVTFAFLTNRKFVYQSQGVITKEARAFYVSRLGTLVVDMLLMYVLVTVIHMNDGIAKVIVQVFVIVANYITGKLLVFRGNTNENIGSSTML